MNNANNMSKYSLRSWVMVLALAPTILVGIVLGGYFTINRYYELEEAITEQASNIIEPLAIAAEAGIENNDFETTKRLITSAQLSNPSLVQFIAIFDHNNRLLVTSHHYNNHEFIRYEQTADSLQATEIEHLGDNLILRSPIYSIKHILSPSFDNKISQAPYNDNGQQLGYIAMLINKENLLLEQHRAAFAAFIIVLIIVQINLLFLFRVIKNVTEPITEMVRVVAKIREGKLDTRLSGSLIGELDLLKRGINAMAGSLSEYHDEMQQNIDQATSELRETLEQIEIQNVELDLAKKRAQEASRIKSEFLANMSHELRTPLNGVIGFSKQLLKTPLHANQRDHINTIERSASNLLGIINDILDFSKLEADKMPLESCPFSLRDSLNDTMLLLANSAHEKQLELVMEIDPAIPEDVVGDPLRFGQIITNLIANAIKFTDQGSILLKLQLDRLEDTHIYLSGEVIDTGIGITQAQQAKLFQAFDQADSSISRRFGGTGLGLVITKRLVERMQGEIGCHSTPHSGSTFWFNCVLQQSPYPINIPIDKQALKNKRVLLLEPRSLSLAAITRVLQSWEMQIQAVSNPNELSLLLQQHDPQFDYAIISSSGLASPESSRSLIQLINAHSNSLLLLVQGLAQQNSFAFLQPFIDNMVATPISERMLAHYLLDPQLQLHHSQPAEQVLTDTRAQAKEQLNVLAVDDNPANLKLIDSLLQEIVTQVTTCDSGDKAVMLAKQQHFDLIFMDIQMPGTDGLSATKLIRQHKTNQHTPVIAVTAHALAEERVHINACGMNDYLAKPIDEAALKQIIVKWKNKSIESGPIDWSLCLSQANNKPDLAMEMLSMFVASVPENMRLIQDALDQFDPKAMLIHVHKLHGASCYCGVPATQKLCHEIESALKKEVELYDIEPEILELLDELTKVELASGKLLSQLSRDQ